MTDKKINKSHIPKVTQKIERGESLVMDYKRFSVSFSAEKLKKLLNLFVR